MFSEDKVTEIFCLADEFCKFFDEQQEKSMLEAPVDGKRHPECKAAMYSVQPEKERTQLFANSKISRCHKEIRMAADYVEWRRVDAATHLPDDYDERDKFIRTRSFKLQDALYNGEC